MLSRVAPSPTRSAISSRTSISLFTGVNRVGVAAHSRSAQTPFSVSVYTVRSRVFPGSLRARRYPSSARRLGSV